MSALISTWDFTCNPNYCQSCCYIKVEVLYKSSVPCETFWQTLFKEKKIDLYPNIQYFKDCEPKWHEQEVFTLKQVLVRDQI